MSSDIFTTDALLFYAFGGAAVLGALLVVSQRNPVYSVLALIASFFGLSGLYVLLEAPFVAVVQIIIYAGAIMVLFLFTVMLLNVPREDAAEWDKSHPLYRPGAVRIGAVLALLMALQLGWALSRTPGLSAGVGDENAAESSVARLGEVLFRAAGPGESGYMFAFEVTSILIIIAMVGAVAIARKRED
jgi:NADH-quinone oxidoreductase subunit J